MEVLQRGRSMVEMLAVLAITAVLSTSGIAAYTLAMSRHRANLILDYVNRCALLSHVYKDGYATGESYCGDLLTDPAPCNLDGREFVVKDVYNPETTTYTITTPIISSERIRDALVARATSTANGEVIDIWDLNQKIEFTYRKN